jgi:hypothetical protein
LFVPNAIRAACGDDGPHVVFPIELVPHLPLPPCGVLQKYEKENTKRNEFGWVYKYIF